MPELFQTSKENFTEENFSKVDRRFLLFQVDLGDKELNTVLGARGLSDTRQPQDVVRISDPVDYDNPSSPIYWRKINRLQDSDDNNIYVKELRNQFALFLAQFQTAISDKKVRLKSTGGSNGSRPYVDISDFVKSVDGYSVRLDGLDNKMNIVLARPESTDMVSAAKTQPGEIVVNFNDDVFGELNPNENDIVVVKSAYSPTDDFSPEFIGMVTKVQKSFSYGKVDSFNLEVFGLSKILASTQMIKNKSVNAKEFIPGIEINDRKKRTTVVPYEHNFNLKDVRAVFRYIVEDSLSCKEIDLHTATFLYRLDPSTFVSFEKFGFQHNIFVLIALYLMSVTEAPQPAENDDGVTARLFPQGVPLTNQALVNGFNEDAVSAAKNATPEAVEPRTAARPLLDFFLRGVIERGNHRAYNRMARQGVEHFFSQMTMPSEILGEVRSNSYCDIFESRDGVIVCRPPRYNKVEQTSSEVERQSAEENPNSLLKLTPQKVWEFNPDSDFVIKSEELESINSISKDEMALESRIDIKGILPYAGPIDYPWGLYVDPDILFRYGLRSHGPVTNPNAYNKKLGRMFAPIALALANAPTRTLEVTVKDNRKYFIGKLYYLESIDMVAYLVQDTISHRYGGHSTRNLSFSMLRQVIRRPITEIQKSPDEVLNVGMMFTTDFPDEAGMKAVAAQNVQFKDFETGKDGGKINPKNLMFAKGSQFLDDLLSESPATVAPDQGVSELPAESHRDASGAENGLRSASDVRLVMFKYMPGIEDLILEVESNPRLAEPPAISNNNIKNAQTEALDARTRTFTKDGFLYFSTGQPFFKSLPFIYARFTPALTAISNELFAQRPEAYSGADPSQVQFQQSVFAPESVAGVLGYLFPTPIQEPSGFIEVAGDSTRAVIYQRTPFRASALADPAQNLVISQVLTNQLASLDLFMKFRPIIYHIPLLPSLDLFALRMDKERIPQLYYLLGDEFLLFGSKLNPNDYIATLSKNFGSDKRTRLPILTFQEDILKYPSVLKLNKDRSAFENDRFSIPIRDGAFNLPYGHFILKQKSAISIAALSGETNLLSYYRAQSTEDKVFGGSFKVDKSNIGGWLISPNNDKSEIVDENTGQTISLNDPPLDRSSPAPNDLYFTSPFLEPTIERLLDFPLPVRYGGNLTADEAEKQKKLSDKGALTSQNFRKDGLGINVSPDYLFIVSRGEIVPKTGFYNRFEAMLFKNNIFEKERARKVANAASASLILSSGKDLGPKSLMFYTLSVFPDDERKYAAKIQVNQGIVVPG